MREYTSPIVGQRFRELLESINLKKSLSKTAYQKAMPELQERLRKLQYAAKVANVSTIVCLEGWDAAGKGRAIRKLTQKLDPRLFRVWSGTPPTPLEQRYHFLHRYQLALPNYGEKKLRFNWNTPIHMSPNEKGTIYIGAQFLFRSRDHGQSWDRISPDLTTNDP